MNIPVLTIIEPYASLIALPDSDTRRKRVENRTWAPPRGIMNPTPFKPAPLLIHAGKARMYGGRRVEDIAAQYGLPVDKLNPGHAIAVASVVAMMPIAHVRKIVHNSPLAWVKDHIHAEGPFCWILGKVFPLVKPFAMQGAQGLRQMEIQPSLLPAEFFDVFPALRPSRPIGLRSVIPSPAVEPVAAPRLFDTDRDGRSLRYA